MAVVVFEHKIKSINQNLFIITEKAVASVIVEVVAIRLSSRERAFSIRKGQTGVGGATIASSSRARARMMKAARAKTSACARATAYAFPPTHGI